MAVNSELRNPANLWRAFAQIARGPLAAAGLQSLAIQVAAIVLGLAQAVILARLLGATDYGIFATAMSVSAILAAIAVGGFDQYAVRELARLRADGDLPTSLAFIRFGNRATLAASILGGAILALVAGAYGGHESDWRNTFMLAAAATPLATLLLLHAGQLRGLGAVVIAQVPVALIRPSALIVLLGAFWIAGLPMMAPQGMTAWLLACGAALLIASAALRSRTVPLAGLGAAPPRARKWLMDAAPFFGSTVVAIIFYQVNTLMLATMAGAQAAGYFQPIASIAPVLALPVMALAMPFAPKVVELWQHGDEATLRRITCMYTLASFTGTTVLGFGILLLGEYILRLFGPAFVSSAPAITWIVAAQILFSALGPSEILLAMTGAQRIVLAAQSAALGVAILIGAMLIPSWGVYGAAVSLAAGIVMGRLITTVVVFGRMGFDPSLAGTLLLKFNRGGRRD